MYEKTLSSEIRYRGRIVDVEVQDVELETGARAVREIVRHVPAVAVVSRRPDGRFVFIRQFRKPAEQIMLEVPAGVLEPGEAPEAGARRELREETGYEPLALRHLGVIYPSPGYVDERIDVFFAELPADPGSRDLDGDERVDVACLTRDEFGRMIRSGEVMDSKTLAAWTLFQHREARTN